MDYPSTKIMGYDVYFPPGKKPFPAQLAVISKALLALSKKQNALLESPTGTGKTLALLSSTLSWLKEEKKKNLTTTEVIVKGEPIDTPSGPFSDVPKPKTPCSASYSTPSTTVTPVVGETIPPTSCNAGDLQFGTPQPEKRKKSTIYFCSRTHSQLQQAVNELKNCHESYMKDMSMCILGSRVKMCVNDDVMGRARRPDGTVSSDTVNEACLEFNGLNPCNYNRDISKAVTAFAQASVWDIEDSLEMGLKHRGCPYFSSRLISQSADIVFAPYNYILEPNIRASCQVALKDAVVVFDEAHNIEDICRSAASLEVTLSSLTAVSKQLSVLTKDTENEVAYRSLHTLINSIIGYLNRVSKLLETMGFEQENNVWGGQEALSILEDELSLTKDTLEVFKRHYETIRAEEDEHQRAVSRGEGSSAVSSKLDIRYDSEDDDGNRSDRDAAGRPGLSSQSKIVISKMLTVFSFMFMNDCQHIDKYKMVIEPTRRERSRGGASTKDISWNLWCLSADVAFKDLADNCHSIILTSGTLSPLDSFASELGVMFPVRVEANHVIDTTSQVYVGAVASCNNMSLSSTYANQGNIDFQDSVGLAVLSLARITDGGVLVFLPSYGLLEKLIERWKATNFLDEFDNEETYTDRYKGAEVFTEPRDSTALDKELSRYYETIDEGNKQAVLFAVCRGKVSEGIDFSDNYARTIVVVGIPFASLGSLQVKLKRQYQDDKSRLDVARHALNGEQWYCQQAYRAVNQAVGRCIRHIRDFGAIVLCDPRFHMTPNQQQLSRWMRSCVRNHSGVEDIILPLRIFFSENAIKFKDHLESLRQKVTAAALSRTAAHDAMERRSEAARLRRQRRKRKKMSSSGSTEKIVADMGDSSALECKQQKTLSQMFQNYKSKVYVKQEPLIGDAESKTDILISGNEERGDVSAEVANQLWEEDTEDEGDEDALTMSLNQRPLSTLEDFLSACEYNESVVPSSSIDLDVGILRLLSEMVEVWLSGPSRRRWGLAEIREIPRELSMLRADSGVFVEDWEYIPSEHICEDSPYELWEEEQWVPEDGVVYRMLFIRAKGHQMSPENLLAVASKVIATSRKNFHMMDTCILNVEVVKLCVMFLTNATDAEIVANSATSSSIMKEKGNQGPFSVGEDAYSSHHSSHYCENKRGGDSSSGNFFAENEDVDDFIMSPASIDRRVSKSADANSSRRGKGNRGRLSLFQQKKK